MSGQSIAKYLAIPLAGAALALSLIGRSRGWLHTTGGLHVWYHVVLFAVLGGLSVCASTNPSKRAEWIVWMLVVGFGIEASQAIINQTTIEWADVGSDMCGIVVGGVVGWVAMSRGRQRR